MPFVQATRQIVVFIARLRPRNLLAGSIAASVLFTLPVVSAMSVIFHGVVKYDYLATGFVTAVLVSFSVMYLVTALLEELNQGKLHLVESEQRIRHLAHFDALTGLPNRILLQDRITQALVAAHHSREQLAILFLDLDRFKTINESLGHGVGDQLLEVIGERLVTVVRDVDTVSRVGGDEFVILLPGAGMEGAAHVADKIRDRISEPCTIEQRNLSITSSIGISVYPDDGFDVEALLKHADAARYQAKSEGRNNYQFFRQDINEAAVERMALEHGLRMALAQEEFVLFFQPQVSMASATIVGVEALLRWKHPDKGLILPNRFIPLAEECGLILPIGEWVLREACRQHALWQNSGILNAPVAVNLSAWQLKQKNLIDMMRQILRVSQLKPGCLELELTESTIMDDTDGTRTTLSELKKLGIHLSIDDFGTGYSNLGYLKHLPIDKIKIDRSFVQGIPHDRDDGTIVRSMIDLAHNLRLRVIAEGVENAEQLAFLHAEGCDEYQGYLFSAPLPAEELTRLLQTLMWQPTVSHFPTPRSTT